MRALAGLFVGVSLLPAPAPAEVVVRVSGDRVDVSATGAPLAEVLDRLAKQTGMRIVYDGPVPRQLVTVSLRERSPAEAVLQLLEGLGLNYVLLGESGGTGVQTLLMAGSAGAATPPPASPPQRADPSSLIRSILPSASGPGADDEWSEEVPEEAPEEIQKVLESLRQGVAPGATSGSPGSPPASEAPTEVPASVLPFAPLPGGFPDYPVSPFTPTPSLAAPAPAQDPAPETSVP
jgi:hypothetical protein